MGNVLKCIRRHQDDPPIPDVIEVIVSQAINEVIDLVSDSDTEIQPMILEDIIPVLELTNEPSSKEESVTEEQVKDEA